MTAPDFLAMARRISDETDPGGPSLTKLLEAAIRDAYARGKAAGADAASAEVARLREALEAAQRSTKQHKNFGEDAERLMFEAREDRDAFRKALEQIAAYTREHRPTGEQHWLHLRDIARRALEKP